MVELNLSQVYWVSTTILASFAIAIKSSSLAYWSSSKNFQNSWGYYHGKHFVDMWSHSNRIAGCI